MPTSENIAQLTEAHTKAHQDLLDFSNTLEQRVAAKEQKIEEFLAGAAASAPVTPNLLVDTKNFVELCGGEINVEKEIIAAHSSLWGAFWYLETQGSGTLKIVSLDKLADEAMPAGGDLLKAIGHTNYPGELFYGSNFNVALFDVTITSQTNVNTIGMAYVLNQGCPTFTGWGRGEFITQSSCFAYVLEHSGDIAFYPHSNMPAEVGVNADDLSKGWVYKHAIQTGWGGCHQPRFVGIGHMKVALALPYIGFGNHQGRYVWAGSVGRYSHFDHLSSEFDY